MASTAEEIFATFPEFADADPTIYLELAEAEQEDLWGDVRYQQAIAFRAAHMMEVAGLGSGSSSGTAGPGAVTSKHIGSLSISYATPGGGGGGETATSLDSTRYGQLLVELLAGAIVPVRTIGCGSGIAGWLAWHR